MAQNPSARGVSSPDRPIEVSMHFVRATKNFLRYEADEPEGPVELLYVKKSAVSGEPKNITLSVKPEA